MEYSKSLFFSIFSILPITDMTKIQFFFEIETLSIPLSII